MDRLRTVIAERSLGTKLLLVAASAVFSISVMGLLALFVLYAIVTPRDFDREEVWKANQTYGITFVTADGEPISRRGAYYAERVKLADLPPHLIQAFISTEDRRFYDHRGIDPKGLVRALLTNFRAGRTVQGGSTITQQTVKNLFLSSDRTVDRKVREMLLAIWLERHMEKDEILELYLNRIYMGAGTYGVDAASRFYFDKPAAQVSLAEAGMLAGVPKAPSKLAPTSNLSKAQDRADEVLRNMVEAGYLSKGDVFAARMSPAVPVIQDEIDGRNYFIDYVSEQVVALVGDPVENLKVTVTLDPDLQRTAEKTLTDRLAVEGPELNVGQGALVTLDTGGAIRAMVGGTEYFESQFNRAVQAQRQPGSAFKPFVFLAALEDGLEPDSVVEDSEVQIGTWSPDNYGGQFKGRMTLRQAFEASVNTVAVRLGQDIGLRSVIEAARRLGISSPLIEAPSVSLGTSEVGLLEITSAYLPFALTGLSADAHAILRIETEGGEVLWEYEAPEPEQLIAKEDALNMTHMMHHVMQQGTGRKARLSGRDAAGKTGTSQDWRDAWFIGYTADYVTGVWVGNDDDTSMNKVVGGALPAEIWRSVMITAHDGRSAKALPGAYVAEPSRAAPALVRFLNDLNGKFRTVSGSRTIVGAKAPISGASAGQSEPEVPVWSND
ncbi:MAG: penicillin-binding protein 1A, partial [Pseudomonadota bacterium]